MPVARAVPRWDSSDRSGSNETYRGRDTSPTPLSTGPASLAVLERLRASFEPGSARRKLAVLDALDGARLANARQVERLHEALCFVRAYPDDQAVLAVAERMLARFAGRADLRFVRGRLENSGIAGTTMRFSFFAPTAEWLARRFPEQLTVDWAEFENRERLDRWLELLVLWAETPALDEAERSVRRWVETLKGVGETDAVFLIRRFAALPATETIRQRLFEELDLPIVLAPGPGTPSRTLARVPKTRVTFQRRQLRLDRPDLTREVRRAPLSIRSASPSEGAALADLAREAMVIRERDLDAFMFADPRDVRRIDLGDGFELACLGVVPERRLLLEAVYGLLAIKNGIPIGYVLASALFASCEIAFNVFESFRGGESAHLYARVLAACRALFSADTFSIYPYQLGHGNEEGLRSGAWWFYAKLGFRPRDKGALEIVRREEAALRADPRHRSSRTTLKLLAAHHLFWSSGARRDDVIGRFPLEEIGFAVTAFLAQRFGADRERGEAVCAGEAARSLDAPDWRRWPSAERDAFRRWAPLLRALPGVESWKAAERAALVRVVRKKGGRRESDFARAFDRHVRLRAALCALAGIRSSPGARSPENDHGGRTESSRRG